MNTTRSTIEALLLVANRPLTKKELTKLTSGSVEEISGALAEIREHFEQVGGGIRLVENSEKYTLSTAPETAGVVGEFVKAETVGDLTRPQLETLTIIAYRGPVAKSELDSIRGVSSGMVIRNLLIRGLIEEREVKGALEAHYEVTVPFLQHLGVVRTEDLPEYNKLNTDERLEEVLETTS